MTLRLFAAAAPRTNGLAPISVDPSATPAALRRSLEETCYQIRSSDNPSLRKNLSGQPGVLTVEPSGAYLHLFLEPKTTSVETLAAKEHFEFKEILPSLEDVFINLMGVSQDNFT